MLYRPKGKEVKKENSQHMRYIKYPYAYEGSVQSRLTDLQLPKYVLNIFFIRKHYMCTVSAQTL